MQLLETNKNFPLVEQFRQDSAFASELIETIGFSRVRTLDFIYEKHTDNRYNLHFKDVGYYPTKHTIYITSTFPHIAHEIAHMVEMKDINRCLLPDWGIVVQGKTENMSDKLLLAGYTRELKVRAIQELIYDNPQKEWNDKLIWRNPYWIEEILKRAPLGRFRTEEDIIEWRNDLQYKTFNHWNRDRIKFEWNKRIEFLSDWMETRH